MKKLFLNFLLVVFPTLGFSQTSERLLSKENWQFKGKDTLQWNSATVPGTVHTDLLNNKLIPDPFYGTNEKQLQWIENEDWEYKTTFSISDTELKNKHIELQFDGLDTYSKVYLNDSLVITADNMFRKWNVEVKKYLHKGENKIYILFESSIRKGKEEAAKLPYTLSGDEKVFTRKAQYQYGWDFGPHFVTCGIWKEIKLIFWNNAKIENVQYIQKSLTDLLSELKFVCEIKYDSTGTYTITANNIVTKNIFLTKGINTVSLDYTINNPKRWWCNGMGEPTLYSFAIHLSKEKNILDKKELSIGLRTIELVQETDSIGKSFYFKLNGVPVFMKGANYIPPDNFLPRVTNENYESIIQNAVDANMNMLRVWGGGVYADDAFYNECGKKGILVWQDFMFACAMYPGDKHFTENVSEEIKQQVERLRNHPCIALWCGNNEIEEGWKNWGWQKQYHYSQNDSTKIWNDYVNLFQRIIPEIVSKEDLQSTYWQSSPSIGWGHKESLLHGDSHYWGVWWGMEPFDVYKNKVGRFMSEYGFQGMPDKNLFDRIGGNDSAIIKAHQKHPTGFKTIDTYMKRDYTVPTRFENYTCVSQFLQAEGMKTAIEAHRRAKPKCMGTLFWQLNDCWPGITWSSIDYYGNQKASYYKAKRSYENILISIVEENNQYKIYVINDELKSKSGNLNLNLMDFSGKTLWTKIKSISITANSSAVYISIDKKDFEKFNFNQIVLAASLTLPDETKEANYCFVKPKDLALTKPTFTIKTLSDNTFEITTDVLAKDVFFSFSKSKFSDNYFDLLPNEKKVITITNNTFEKNILVKSLYDINNK